MVGEAKGGGVPLPQGDGSSMKQLFGGDRGSGVSRVNSLGNGLPQRA